MTRPVKPFIKNPPNNMAELVFSAARQWPEKTALINEPTGERISYAELAEQVRRLAGALEALGLAKGDKVGLLLYNQPAFVMGYFALLALGVTVIPLNTRLTATEIDAILEDADARMLISGTAFAEVLQSLSASGMKGCILATGDDPAPTAGDWPLLVFLLDTLLTQDRLPAKPLPYPTDRQTVATLIYTSGTTGKPKGVMLSHHNILFDAGANVQVIEAMADDVFITISPMFHVFGQTNILVSAFMVGATVVLVEKFSPRTVLAAIERYRVTFMAAVPTMYQMMLSHLREQNYDLSSLRVCHSGAAPMSREVFRQVEETFGTPVQEGYGLSEASSIITSNPMHGARKPGSVGLPLPGITVKVLDEEFNELPPGEIGEIHVRGDTVMLGYYRRPQETDATLVNGWLKSRDLAFRDEDGYIHIVDRRDDLINVGGVKVYPREIEEVLYRHPAVKAVAVIGIPAELYNEAVKAFVVLHAAQANCRTEDLQAFCQGLLAPYKIPQHFEFVNEIPQGATGKILRKELRKPSAS